MPYNASNSHPICFETSARYLRLRVLCIVVEYGIVVVAFERKAELMLDCLRCPFADH
jgi:hypothetical protein